MVQWICALLSKTVDTKLFCNPVTSVILNYLDLDGKVWLVVSESDHSLAGYDTIESTTVIVNNIFRFSDAL